MVQFSSVYEMYFALYYVTYLPLLHRQKKKYIYIWNSTLSSLTVAGRNSAAFTRTSSSAIWSVGTVQQTTQISVRGTWLCPEIWKQSIDVS